MAVRERSKSLEELPSKHYQVTVENTKLKTQGNSPFDFKNMLLGLIFFRALRHFQIRSYRPAWELKLTESIMSTRQD